MKIKTATCNAHRARYGWSQEHAAHAYRSWLFGARRCPENRWMSDLIQYEFDHPSVEERTYRELRRIRELLEEQGRATGS